MDGLAATANTVQKIDNFRATFGGLRPQTPNAHPSNKSRFTFRDTQTIVSGTKKFWAACRFSGIIFAIIVKNAKKLGQLCGRRFLKMGEYLEMHTPLAK